MSEIVIELSQWLVVNKPERDAEEIYMLLISFERLVLKDEDHAREADRCRLELSPYPFWK